MSALHWMRAGAAAGLMLLAAVLLVQLRRNTALRPAENAPVPAVLHLTDGAPAPDTDSDASAMPETAYLLKLQGDRLLVFREGETEAFAAYDLPAGWLPDYDRVLLEYGMRVGNAAELQRLLEDYVS